MSDHFTRLTNHPFTKRVFRDGLQIEDTVTKPDQVFEPKPDTREVDEYEYYVLRVSSRLSHLLILCDQLTHIPFYLSTFTPTLRMKAAGISRASQLLYHIESYFIRVSSVEDRALQLVDAVFHLGNDPRDARFHTVTRNAHVRNSPVPGTLKELSKATARYAATRNLVVHQEAYQDRDLRQLEGLVLAQGYSDDPAIPHFIRSQVRHVVRTRTKEFQEFNSLLFGRLYDLFDGLQTTYSAQCGDLAHKCGHGKT